MSLETWRSTASPSSIHAEKAALGSISRSDPRALSISLSSSRPAAISVAMAIRVEKPPVALIAGPTASGKSALALRLAEQVGGVIVNADSAQIYRDLPILSAAPGPHELKRAEHRLYGVLDGADACSAAGWAAMAKREIGDIHAVGGLPILVGGTGLLPPHPSRRYCADPANRSGCAQACSLKVRRSEPPAVAETRSRGSGAIAPDRHHPHRSRSRGCTVQREDPKRLASAPRGWDCRHDQFAASRPTSAA